MKAALRRRMRARHARKGDEHEKGAVFKVCAASKPAVSVRKISQEILSCNKADGHSKATDVWRWTWQTPASHL
jgi:hypothetical protein